ncbi:MAG: hypothetical protein F4051_15980 [Boseongicola sp. SB0670_bin_30]|nr:hypothetical protein [Boseongicola sp. SB0670_bin_30]
MKDEAPGANDRDENDGEDTIRIELPREACETLSEMCALLAHLIADSDCGCEACDQRFTQAEAWEDAFRALAESGPGGTHELVVGQEGYVH